MHTNIHVYKGHGDFYYKCTYIIRMSVCSTKYLCSRYLCILKIPIFKKLCLDNIQIVDFCFYRALIAEVNFLYAY